MNLNDHTVVDSAPAPLVDASVKPTASTKEYSLLKERPWPLTHAVSATVEAAQTASGSSDTNHHDACTNNADAPSLTEYSAGASFHEASTNGFDAEKEKQELAATSATTPVTAVTKNAFVEAPVPKVNPWKVRKDVQSADVQVESSGPSKIKNQQTIEHEPSVKGDALNGKIVTQKSTGSPPTSKPAKSGGPKTNHTAPPPALDDSASWPTPEKAEDEVEACPDPASPQSIVSHTPTDAPRTSLGAKGSKKPEWVKYDGAEIVYNTPLPLKGRGATERSNKSFRSGRGGRSASTRDDSSSDVRGRASDGSYWRNGKHKRTQSVGCNVPATSHNQGRISRGHVQPSASEHGASPARQTHEMVLDEESKDSQRNDNARAVSNPTSLRDSGEISNSGNYDATGRTGEAYTSPSLLNSSSPAQSGQQNSNRIYRTDRHARNGVPGGYRGNRSQSINHQTPINMGAPFPLFSHPGFALPGQVNGVHPNMQFAPIPSRGQGIPPYGMNGQYIDPNIFALSGMGTYFDFSAMQAALPQMGFYEMIAARDVVLKQIEYYFSLDNLPKDIYLRKHMDSKGFVPLSVLANFPKVKALSQDLAYITDTLMNSMEIEVVRSLEGLGHTLLRRRNGWQQWIFPEDERDSSARQRTVPSSPEIAAGFFEKKLSGGARIFVPSHSSTTST